VLGLGLGLCLGGLVMLTQGARRLPPAEVERLARSQGMVYPQEVIPFAEDGTAEDGRGRE